MVKVPAVEMLVSQPAGAAKVYHCSRQVISLELCENSGAYNVELQGLYLVRYCYNWNKMNCSKKAALSCIPGLGKFTVTLVLNDYPH